MVWITRKVIRVERDGESVLLEPGSPIPEAETWDKEARRYWVRRGYLAEIPRPTPSSPVSVSIQHVRKSRPTEILLTDWDETPVKKKKKRNKTPKTEEEPV